MHTISKSFLIYTFHIWKRGVRKFFDHTFIESHVRTFEKCRT